MFTTPPRALAPFFPRRHAAPVLFALGALGPVALAQPLHHFSFDEESGLTTSDRACGRGELLGFELDDDAQWVDGRVNGALNLGADGTFDNRVAVDLAATTNGFTVALWINPGEQILTPGEYQLLATPGDTVGFTIMNFDGEVRHDRVLLFWDGDLPDLHVGTTTLEPGTWYHVAITSTGAGGEKLYYLDGQPEPQTLFVPSMGGTEGFHPGTAGGWAAGPATFGAIPGSRYHDSVLDDIRIYDTALSEDRIAELAAAVGHPAPTFTRGDADGSGSLNITDGIYVLNFLFLGGPKPPAPESCGMDPSADDLDCAEATSGCGA